LALTGALTGWFAGILATPLSKKEGQRFNELAKVISGFVSGYLLSKVDPLVGALFQIPASGRSMITDPYVAKQALVTLSSFFTALLFVLGGRLYWTNPNDVSVLDGQRGAAGKSLSTAPYAWAHNDQFPSWDSPRICRVDSYLASRFGCGLVARRQNWP
jgi:hypothetical protein